MKLYINTLFYYTIFFIKKQVTLPKPRYGNQKASLAIDFAMKKFSRLARSKNRASTFVAGPAKML